jgi:betaine-aldehyde dehydrogenase
MYSRSRLFLEESIKDEFMTLFQNKVSQIKVGDPTLEETQMGPLISKSQLETVDKYVQLALEEGAQIICGGKRLNDKFLGDGNYYLPTIIDQVKNDMTVAQEEIFGPVVSVLTFTSVEEVIEMANDIIYGLAGTIWTENINKAHSVASKIRVGNISINQPQVNFMNAPFGGYKQSGIGRERGKEGILLYTQTKNIALDVRCTQD